MTVDSEAVFAIAAHRAADAKAFEELYGSMAAAWLDERRPEVLYLARGVGRPLWLGESPAGVFFASTEHALGVVESYCAPGLRKRESRTGSCSPSGRARSCAASTSGRASTPKTTPLRPRRASRSATPASAGSR